MVRGHAWWVGMCGRGRHAWQGGMQGRGVCVWQGGMRAGGMHGEGCACLGVVHAWDRMTDACKILPCRKLRLRAVISKMF